MQKVKEKNNILSTISLEDDSIFDFQNGLWKGKSSELIDVRVLRNTNFRNNGKLSFDNIAELPVDQKSFQNRELSKGDILLERSGGGPDQPVGRVAYFDKEERGYSFSNFTTRIRVINKDIILPKYLNYFLLFFYKSGIVNSLQKRTTGIRNLDFGEYKKLRIHLLPIPEQQKIVEILDKVQKAIDVQEKLIQKTQELKQTIMHKLFTEGTRGEKQKKTRIGKIPESWEMEKIKDLSIEIIDGDRGKNYPRKEDFSKEGHCLFLNTKNVMNEGFDFNECNFITKKKDEKLRGGKLQRGDIVLTTRGTVGNIAHYNDDIDFKNIRINSGMVILREESQKIDTEFILRAWKSHIVKGQVRGVVSGSAQPQLPINVLKNIKIPIPFFKKEQEEIGDILQTIDEKIEIHKKKKGKKEELFRSLLHKLMSGEIKVKKLHI